jgi:uncharacterized protein
MRVVALAALVSLLGCGRPATREEVLRALVSQQLVSDMEALSRDSTALLEATSSIDDPWSEPKRLELRAQWRRTLLAWERLYALRIGPIVDNSGLLRARFWPVRTERVSALLRDPEPLTEARVERLGVDLRGMYALEWLLFAEPAQLLLQKGRDGLHARAAIAALSANADRYAQQAGRQLGDGSALATSFSHDAQQSVSRLVNQMTATIEILASERLGPTLERHAAGGIRKAELPGEHGGVSHLLVLTQLEATERLYLGAGRNGLAALVAEVAPAIDAHVRARFARARALLGSFVAPIEVTVRKNQNLVAQTSTALKELELALKVDLASALGVTLVFNAGDGD